MPSSHAQSLGFLTDSVLSRARMQESPARVQCPSDLGTCIRPGFLSTYAALDLLVPFHESGVRLWQPGHMAGCVGLLALSVGSLAIQSLPLVDVFC